MPTDFILDGRGWVGVEHVRLSKLDVAMTTTVVVALHPGFLGSAGRGRWLLGACSMVVSVVRVGVCLQETLEEAARRQHRRSDSWSGCLRRPQPCQCQSSISICESSEPRASSCHRSQKLDDPAPRWAMVLGGTSIALVANNTAHVHTRHRLAGTLEACRRGREPLRSCPGRLARLLKGMPCSLRTGSGYPLPRASEDEVGFYRTESSVSVLIFM